MFLPSFVGIVSYCLLQHHPGQGLLHHVGRVLPMEAGMIAAAAQNRTYAFRCKIARVRGYASFGPGPGLPIGTAVYFRVYFLPRHHLLGSHRWPRRELPGFFLYLHAWPIFTISTITRDLREYSFLLDAALLEEITPIRSFKELATDRGVNLSGTRYLMAPSKCLVNNPAQSLQRFGCRGVKIL